MAVSSTGFGDVGATLGVLLEGLPNLVWIADSEGRIKFVNSRWMEYTGCSAAELSNERGLAHGIVHPNDLERTWQLWRKSLETSTAYEISYRLRSKQDGTYRWFLARAVPVFDASKNVVEWVGAATDIDREVRARSSSRFFSEAAGILSSSLELGVVLSLFVKLAVDVFSDACIVLLIEGDETKIAAMAHKDPEIERRLREFSQLPRLLHDDSLEQVLVTRKPVLVASVPQRALQAVPKSEEHLSVLKALNPRSLVVVPLVVADSLIGAISFISSDPTRCYDAEDLETAAATARQAALAIENARAMQRERMLTSRLRVLAHATEELFSSIDTADIFQRLLDAITSEMADCAIAFRVEHGSALRVEAVAHREDEERAALQALVHQRPFSQRAEQDIVSRLRRRSSYVRNDIEQGALAGAIQRPFLAAFASLSARSAVVTSLSIGEEMIGVIIAFSAAARDDADGDLALFDEIGRRASVALEHTRSLARERHIAKTLQEVTLPSSLPAVPGALLSTVYSAASSDLQVGGDWYDAFDLPDGKLLLTIGDVVGHGLEASVIMGKLRHFFNVISMYESDPARILDAAERILLQRYPNAIATAFLAIFDRRAGRIAFANAGHPYPVARLRDGSLVEFQADGLPIGLRTMASAEGSRSRTMEDVVLLTLFTDGLVEATRDFEQGQARLRAMMSRDAMLYTRSAAAAIASSCLPATVRDDVALLVLAFPGSSVWTFEADDAQASQVARKEFVRQLRDGAAVSSDFGGAELIFGELIGNVVRHAPGPVDIALEWHEDGATLHAIDRGPRFRNKGEQPTDIMREDGRGLWLVQLLGRAFRVHRLPRFGNHIQVVLPVTRAPRSWADA